ncbi:MAG: hypothetical protein F8N37_14540 [Telmatospirillum sp.]|nr:hypothetical protein [Telmatospirillum sp.]
MKSVADIHADILARHAKAPSKFSYFFLQWIKFANNSDDLFTARGASNENYLQFRLSQQHVDSAAVIFDTIVSYWREKEQESRIFSYLTQEDKDGNGIWHYLAGTLHNHEGLATLRMARTLLSMDIDFSRRNKFGQSPLSKMLLPTPRWKSLNALIQARHLSIENVENAISEQAKEDTARNQLMSFLFSSDISVNQGLLSQHVLHQAVQPQADMTLRAATCRLFFDYVDAEDHSPAFFKLLGIANHAMFDDIIRLLVQNTAETISQMGAPDVATRKAYAQLYLAKRLLRRDKSGEGLLFKSLAAGKYNHMAKITSLLRNDDLTINTMVRGETVRKPVTVDKTSPAPTNPLLSLLLQQDQDGNTVFHHAVAASDLQALRRLLSGLAPSDLYAIIQSVPNKVGVTLMQMISDPELVKRRMFKAAVDKIIAPARAKKIVDGVAALDGDVRDFLIARVKEIEELAKSVGRKGPLPPSFHIPAPAHRHA